MVGISDSPEAVIASVAAGSPADRAALQAGMKIRSVNDSPLHDILDWLWLTDGSTITLTVASDIDSDIERTVHLRRSGGEPWGIEFTDPLFDGLRTCVNDCIFCYLDMLPPGLRSNLYRPDDDFRLSFLQGSFVTLTNISDADCNLIIKRRLSPLHVSLHAVAPEVRRTLMGDNAPRGMQVLQALLSEDIAVHAQIVLVPNINDGPTLDETLAWVTAEPSILSVGVVPYAYTRYAQMQTSYTSEQAADIIDALLPLAPRVQLADEWFVRAGRKVPAAEYYGDFPQYENGIGLIRGFIDDWPALSRQLTDFLVDKPGALVVSSQGFQDTLSNLINAGELAGRLKVIAVENRFFGGCVNVAGLLTGSDVLVGLAGWCDAESSSDVAGARVSPHEWPVILPAAMFNDDGLTLDGMTIELLRQKLGRAVYVLPC